MLRPLSWTLPRRWRFQAEARQRRRGGGWLAPADLDPIVRSSLCSLPPLLYQDPLAVDPQLVMDSVVAAEPTTPWVVEREPLVAAPDRTAPVTTSPWDGAGKTSGPPIGEEATLSGQKTLSPEPVPGSAGEEQINEPLRPISRSADPMLSPSPTANQTGTIASLAWHDRWSSVEGAGTIQLNGPGGPAVKNLAVQGLAVLDGRRRVVTILGRRPQDSSSASSLIG